MSQRKFPKPIFGFRSGVSKKKKRIRKIEHRSKNVVFWRCVLNASKYGFSTNVNHVCIKLKCIF